MEYNLDGSVMKRFLVIFLVLLIANSLAVKADIVKDPVCRSGGQIISCPDIVPDRQVENKNYNVEQYHFQPVKYNKHHKPKIKKRKYKYGFIQPAYADIPKRDFTGNDEQSTFFEQNKIIPSVVLLILIIAAVYSIRRKRDDKHN